MISGIVLIILFIVAVGIWHLNSSSSQRFLYMAPQNKKVAQKPVKSNKPVKSDIAMNVEKKKTKKPSGGLDPSLKLPLSGVVSVGPTTSQLDPKMYDLGNQKWVQFSPNGVATYTLYDPVSQTLVQSTSDNLKDVITNPFSYLGPPPM